MSHNNLLRGNSQVPEFQPGTRRASQACIPIVFAFFFGRLSKHLSRKSGRHIAGSRRFVRSWIKP